MEEKILYEDKYILALLKPAGVLSQPDEGSGLHIINRLDRPVGGIVLFAKDKKTAADLTALMKSGSITKRYLAAVCADCPDEGSFTDYIAVNRRLNISKIVNSGMPGAKEARLAYRTVMRLSGEALILVRLYTGRHHQIRAQLAHHNMPIWGDTKYNEAFKHKRGVMPALFACSMELAHPVTGKMLLLRALPNSGRFLNYGIEEIDI